jgi:alpha-amylase/alpha-mannosidase (GH57 family)
MIMNYTAEIIAPEINSLSDLSSLEEKITITEDDLINEEVATGVYVVVHGHFYQPPRENPYLDAIERQPSASPFHDWNERINDECYKPNGFARVFNDHGEIVDIVNNYEYLSFNIGPTLMNWLERNDQKTYQRIIAADRQSCQRLNGHGNAIAQVYNHIILPLANHQDKLTQIRWGKYDFKSRFGRDPEGMWLAETAINYETLAALIQEGIKFIVLAPSQVEKCRLIATTENPHPDWIDVSSGDIDPTRPYRCYLRPKNNELSDSIFAHVSRDKNDLPYIDIFFYDGPISRDIGFNDVLDSSSNFCSRIAQAIRNDDRPCQLIAFATDGETFGHHKRDRERCIAHAFTQEFIKQNWKITNFAHFLSINPPIYEVELKPITAWSCCHGVNRWQDDCGCGSVHGWTQQWRQPLRNALNWLRDQLITIYEEEAGKLFNDPWVTRDEYIAIIRDRSSENVANFLNKHQVKPLSPSEQVEGLKLLEMQKQALLMFTSCGWFFEEISRPEGVQILRYAARAIELAGEVSGIQLEQEFLEQLESAHSNVYEYKNGAEVYRQLVLTAQVNFSQIAAHYAISSLFSNYPQQHHLYCYETHQLDYHLQKMGSLTLAIGQIRLVSEITWESEHLIFVVLHLGGWDFHCAILPYTGRRAYSYMKDELISALSQGSAANLILKMVQLCGEETFNLQDLFVEERQKIMKLLNQETLAGLDKLYSQVYRENYGVLMAFQRDQLPIPQEIQFAAQIAIGYRFIACLKNLEQEIGEIAQGLNDIVELEAIATESKLMQCSLNMPEGKEIMQRIIERSLWHLLYDYKGKAIETELQKIERILTLAQNLNIGIKLEHTQEIFTKYLTEQILPQYMQLNQTESHLNAVQQILKLGKKLGVDVNAWILK